MGVCDWVRSCFSAKPLDYSALYRQGVVYFGVLLLGASHNAPSVAWEEGGQDSWVLVGTLISPIRNKAVFQHGNGTERILMQGDAIADCTVEGIDSRYVSLSCGDQQTLFTLDYGLGYSAPPTRHLARDTATQQSYAMSRTRLLRLVQDRQRLVGQISLIPEIENDTMVGYRVRNLKPDGDFTDLGLRNEDVITAVNGTPANQPQAFIDAVNASGRIQVLNVDIERGNRLLSINYVLH